MQDSSESGVSPKFFWMQMGHGPSDVSVNVALHRSPWRGSPLNVKWKLMSRNFELEKLDCFPLVSSREWQSSVFSPSSKFSLDAVMKSLFSKSCILFPLNYVLRLNSSITCVPGLTERRPVTSWSPAVYKNDHWWNGHYIQMALWLLGFYHCG